MLVAEITFVEESRFKLKLFMTGSVGFGCFDDGFDVWFPVSPGTLQFCPSLPVPRSPPGVCFVLITMVFKTWFLCLTATLCYKVCLSLPLHLILLKF